MYSFSYLEPICCSISSSNCCFLTCIQIDYTNNNLSLVAQTVKSLPAIQETWIRFLGQEDPLEKEMATGSSTLAWKIPWTEEPGRLQFTGSLRVGHNWATSLHFTCCSMSSYNCCFLTCIQISEEAGQVVWYSQLLKNFPVYCDPHSQRLWVSQ